MAFFKHLHAIVQNTGIQKGNKSTIYSNIIYFTRKAFCSENKNLNLLTGNLINKGFDKDTCCQASNKLVSYPITSFHMYIRAYSHTTVIPFRVWW